MIDDVTFKGLLRDAEEGKSFRALVLVENSPERDQLVIHLSNLATGCHANVVYNRSQGNMYVGVGNPLEAHCVLMLRIVHSRVDEQVRGYHLTSAHGLDLLNKLEDGDRIKGRILGQVS